MNDDVRLNPALHPLRLESAVERLVAELDRALRRIDALEAATDLVHQPPEGGVTDGELALSVLTKLCSAGDDPLLGYVNARMGVFDCRVTLTDEEIGLVGRLLAQAGLSR